MQKIEQCVRKMEFFIPDSEHNGKIPSKCAKFQFIIFQGVLVIFGLGLVYQFGLGPKNIQIAFDLKFTVKHIN